MPTALRALPDPPRTPTILVVEDEALLRVTLSHFLQECGFNVLEAVNGDEAVQILDQGGIAIDLVLDKLQRGSIIRQPNVAAELRLLEAAAVANDLFEADGSIDAAVCDIGEIGALCREVAPNTNVARRQRSTREDSDVAMNLGARELAGHGNVEVAAHVLVADLPGAVERRGARGNNRKNARE